MRSSRQQIGVALERLIADLKDDVLLGCAQAEARAEPHTTALMKQTLDMPNRLRASFNAWVADYNSEHGPGTAQAFLTLCLQKAGADETLGTIDQQLTAIEGQALALVNHRLNDGWTWAQVIASIRASIAASEATDFDYSRLPLPPGYLSIWGTPP